MIIELVGGPYDGECVEITHGTSPGNKIIFSGEEYLIVEGQRAEFTKTT